MGVAYRHSMLSSSTSIRVFHLFPGSVSEVLKGAISTTNLENHPSYEAVSYVWGSENGKPLISINTEHGLQQLAITQNLHDGLKRLRHRLVTRTLWIDSICINQMSVEEKNQQVPLMGAVYRQATRVLIWLGEGSSSNKPAKILKCMWKLHHAIDAIYALEAKLSNGLPSEFYAELGVAGRDPDKIHKSLRIPLLDSIEFQAFQELVRNPWFVRAWTWQESFVAKDRLFHLGNQSWSREPIVKAIIALFTLRNITGLTEKYAYENKYVQDMLGNETFWTHHSEYREFREVLKQRRGSGCKYPGDLIYSLLVAGKSPPIEVDYNIQWETVFTQCAWHLIVQLGDFSILRDVERYRQPSKLPSWVPDWRVRTPLRRHMLSVSTALRYHATGSSRAKATLSTDSSTLTAAGILFDRVMHIEDAECRDLEYRIAALFGDYNDVEQIYAPTGETLKLMCQRVMFRDTMEWKEGGVGNRWKPDSFKQYEATWRDFQKDENSKIAFGRMIRALEASRAYRSVLVTQNGRVGLTTNLIQPGDVIVLLMGSDMPLALRPVKESYHYRYIGDCYIHGFMDGEGLIELKRAANPTSNLNDALWLTHLHEIELPFPVRDFHII